MIKQILEEMNVTNSTLDKRKVLTAHKDNELLQRVLKMGLDNLITYGVTMRNIPEVQEHKDDMLLDDALTTMMALLSTRKVTGNAAIEQVHTLLTRLSEDDAYVLEKIINRDFRLNFGRTEINKIMKGLIQKTPYNRCGIADKKALANINWEDGIYSELKMDGTYRSFNSSQFTARSGQESSFPHLEKIMENVPNDYVLIGELTLKGETQRSKGNGLINSDNPPEADLEYTIWDAIHVNEFKMKNGDTPYEERLELVKKIVKDIDNEQVQVVPYKIVYSPKEAFEHFQELTNMGLEGTVIKTRENFWKDGTPKTQLKMKLEISVDVRIVGVTEGNGKRAKYFGALEYVTDDGKVKGRVSGFSDKVMKEIHADLDSYIGKVMEIECNDITKAKGSETWALSHPRYICLRDDKNTTDEYERILQSKEMAMMLS